MRAMLRPHPDFPAPAIAIEGEAERSGAALSLTFRLGGDLDGVRIPAASASPGRADELWRRTCFEAFVAPEAGESYVELNLSPSGEWAAYGFDGYRGGMSSVAAAPWVELKLAEGALVLRAKVDLSALSTLSGAWRLGLSAVIEATDRSLSYWAVAHLPGRPDFHHRDCLALELAAPQDT
jgi:hypothetical protein